MADKEIKCPWCGTQNVPEMIISKKQKADIVERKCLQCGRTLAAYRKGEGDFFPKIRVFENQ